MERFCEEIYQGDVSEFSAHKGLPYSLIYNLVHGRINSLSAADYRRIFGESPPEQEREKVSGEYFRGMVRLWLFLNDRATEKELYVEFYHHRRSVNRPDYRIFTGATKTVEKRLERIMERKFLDQGLERAEIQAWIREVDRYPGSERVSFHKVKPILARLEKNLKVHPTRLLNRRIASYESGELKTISGELFEKVKVLDRKAEEAMRNPSRAKFEKLREEIYGTREGLVLFSEIEEELVFLKAWGARSPKKYLGRSMGKYRRSTLKRIAIRRAESILQGCEKLIAEKPEIPVKALPRRYRRKQWNRLTRAFEQAIVARMSSKDKLSFEKQVLRPLYHTKTEYESGGHGFVNVQEAARVLNMSEKAFGLLMAAHSEIFKQIGRYDGRWLIPDLYLTELSGRREFSLVKAKYEWLAKRVPRPRVSALTSPGGTDLAFQGRKLEAPGVHAGSETLPFRGGEFEVGLSLN